MKKYICVGGWVRSKDGDMHFISSHKLPKLYGAPKSECKFVYNNTYLLKSDKEKFVILRPDSLGRYSLLKGGAE
jgi:hypothetical protein